MQRLILLTLLLILTSFTKDEGLLTYCNARFAFCIEYPKSFNKLPPSENGDGLIFLSQDKQTEIRAFGSLAIENYDRLKQVFSLSANDIKLTYKMITEEWFVFSGITRDGKIIYQKTRRRKIKYMGEPGTFVFQTLMITYPSSQRKIYEEYCLQVAGSFD